MRAFLLVVGAVVMGLAFAPGAGAATCHDATSSFTNLRSISCAQAKQVMHQARTGLGADEKPPFMPECKGDPIARWHGWRFQALGALGIDVVASKGSQSFHFGGGGACS